MNPPQRQKFSLFPHLYFWKNNFCGIKLSAIKKPIFTSLRVKIKNWLGWGFFFAYTESKLWNKKWRLWNKVKLWSSWNKFKSQNSTISQIYRIKSIWRDQKLKFWSEGSKFYNAKSKFWDKVKFWSKVNIVIK